MKEPPETNHLTPAMRAVYGRVFGLTGVIGSGKSTAASIFTKYGAIIIDADSLAREIMSDNFYAASEIKDLLIEQFQNLLKPPFSKLYDNNQLNRAALASVAFSDEAKIKQLNRITHPYISQLFVEQASRALSLDQAKVVIYDVPLLFESNLHKLMKETIVVYAPEHICIERASNRMQLSEHDIKKRLERQISIEKKAGMADYVIDNSGTLEHLSIEVSEVWHKLVRVTDR